MKYLTNFCHREMHSRDPCMKTERKLRVVTWKSCEIETYTYLPRKSPEKFLLENDV